VPLLRALLDGGGWRWLDRTRRDVFGFAVKLSTETGS